MYCKIRRAISPLMFLALICYYPGCVALELWLPKYAESLRYLGILLPIIIYTTKVSLLTNNYLKAYRKERTMLIINTGAVSLGIILFLICAWIINSLTVLLCAIVFTIILRSVVSEIVVMKMIHTRLWKEFAIELAMTALFIGSTFLSSRWQGCLVYVVCLCVYFVIQRKELRDMLCLSR